MKSSKSKEISAVVKVPPPNVQIGRFEIIGTAPYVQLQFSKKALATMQGLQEQGGKKAKAKKEPRNFEDDYKQSMHVSTEGWHGIPASALRNALVRAAKLAGFAMTDAKVTLFVEADGIDRDSGMPLVKIIGKPERYDGPVRNANGSTDIRVRAMWREWKATVNIRFDADFFSLSDVSNMLGRAGLFVGIGEGRADSKKSAGMGWGHFKIEEER